ncbi:MAG TPA: DNA polymerase I [Candidatus Coprenecus stercoravium]|uniref:DNA polymerase I n=1 Tax=Candidatus Coprenecus stercoravium TaxID=2840735 RepID=A0A9D2K9M5_9BACT|nr:DNA polymerase I [Candidatus Coprenecus stercoravium]
MSGRLFIIDGHALMFRMYYAFIRRPMVNSKGVDTSVIFGFSRYLLDLIAREKPSHLAVAFDPPCKTFRHEAYPEYKANRSAAPEVIKDSLEPLTAIVKSMGIPVLMVPGYEADDIIGSMAREWSGKGYDVYMVSPDKDLGQLVSDHVYQVKPGKNGSDDEIMDRQALCGKFGINSPTQIIDILTIWGDASDNVPGVRGIGEVGAKKLVSRYGSVDGIMQHIGELPPKQAEAMREASDHLEMSRFLVTIKTDVDTGCSEEDLRLDISDATGAAALFNEYECTSLLPLLPSAAAAGKETAATTEQSRHHFDITSDHRKFASLAEDTGVVGIVLQKTDDAAHPHCFLAAADTVLSTDDPVSVKDILESEKTVKTGYGLKQYIQILRTSGITLGGPLADIELMHYLINPETSHRPDILVQSYLGLDLNACRTAENGTEDDTDAPEPDLFSSPAAPETGDESAIAYRCSADASLMPHLRSAILKDYAKDPSLSRIYDTIEMPLIRVLADMEYCGVRIDTAMLAAYGKELGKELSAIEDRIREATGEPGLNISSPVQLGAVLFDKLKLDPKAKKNKKGNYSTDEETLTALTDRHPVIKDILRFRAIKKLLSTYIEPFPSLIDPRDGKVHTTFNQALTATGRLSSTHPNLQNIPIRTEMGREIRKAFVPSGPDNVIISADYSQIELRLMASISGDKDMIEAFRQGRDIHTATAAKVFKVDEKDVTQEQRRRAKTANFGIIYGISAFGLSQRLEIPRKEAKELIDEYFHHYPAIAEYMERTKEEARSNGYVSTIFGRRRYIKDINSRNVTVRGFAERNAINAPIQGSAADIIKMAMNNVAAALKNGGYSTRMILQVHDELVFDAPKSEAQEIMALVRREMEDVVRLSVPLTVECGCGSSWLEAH